MTTGELDAVQQTMIATWESHMAAEFAAKSIEATMATMTAEPFVNHVPVMTGGVGGDAVRRFYETYFLTGHPPDTQAVPIARTVGTDRIVDEMAFSFTHTIEMPWILPGVPPTGKHVEVAVVAVVEFQNGKVSGERIYWDQASVLAQVGLIDPLSLPVTGSEACAKASDPANGTSNALIHRAISEAGAKTAA